MTSDIFKNTKTIAVIGLSDNPEKHSHKVASYFQTKGFRIIPVNPNLTEVLGEKAYPDLLSIPKEIKIDIVDVFRRPEEVIPHLEEVLKRGEVSTVWLQEGVGSKEAEDFAKKSGISLVSNFCMMEAHKNTQESQND
jgi:predicted CoA-binding protein